MTTGGRFDFDDGGTYCGGWEDGKAHGFGVCTGPKGQGEYAGAWHCGYEISGIYTWTSGNNYKGQWTQGKRHGVGVETKGRWIYHGEWTQGFKGRYGVRQSSTTGATYEGTWTTGLQDGYGVETYADGGTYQGQWLRGIRHGYGVRQSVPYGLAAYCRQKSSARDSLTSLRSEQDDDNAVKDRDRKMDEGRGGFVLTGSAFGPRDPDTLIRRPGLTPASGSTGRGSSLRKIVDGLKLRKQRSTGDIKEATQSSLVPGRPGGGSVRSTISNVSRASSLESAHSGMTAGSMHTDSNASFISQDEVADLNMVETYSGEWKNDKRAGFGVSERSDGLKYEGEWEGNKKHGYGATTFRDGSREEGKYKNNVLVTSGRRSKLFILRANKLKDRVENAVTAASRAAQIAHQKADIAVSRMASARGKAEQAQMAAFKSQTDAEKGRLKAQEYDPNFLQPGIDIMKKEQEQLEQQQQKQQANNRSQQSFVGQQQGSTFENNVPHLAYQSAISVSKSILSRVGLGGGDASKSEPTGLRNQSILASALAGAAAESVLVGGGTAAVVVQKGGNNRMPARTAEVAPTPVKPTPPGPDGGGLQANNKVNGRLPGTLPAQNAAANRRQADTVASSLSPPVAGTAESRFSQLLNPSVIDDHFDQYTVTGLGGSRPTGLAGYSRQADFSDETMPSFSYDNVDRGNAGGPLSSAAADSDENHRPRHPLQRRKTLPGGHAQLLIATSAAAPLAAPVASATDGKSSGGSGAVVLRRANNSTLPTPAQQPAGGYGQRARPGPVPSSSLVRSKGADMGSMPDVSKCAAAASGPAPAMTREEVHVLSQRRREELRKLREDAERRHQLDIVLRVGDIKDWCQQRQLLVLVIALNISLATMFFNLLSR